MIKDKVNDKDDPEGQHVESIKVVRLSDKENLRGVFICTDDNGIHEEIKPTPMGACGIMTFMDGRFVLIENNGETTLHFANARSEGEVIDSVLLLAEKKGLAKGIKIYKSKTQQIPMFNNKLVAAEAAY